MPLPAPVLLTDSELDLCCDWLRDQVYIYYPVASSFMNDLYNTGCRPQELLDQTLWIYNSPTDVELTPLKGNSTRTFLEADLSASLIYAIQNNIKPYNSLTLRQLTSVMKKMITWFKIETVDKSAIDYGFRYNVIKKLHNAGSTDAAIQAVFGWSSSLMPASYYGQSLYIVGSLPTSTFYITDNSRNFLIDDSSNFIISQ